MLCCISVSVVNFYDLYNFGLSLGLGVCVSVCLMCSLFLVVVSSAVTTRATNFLHLLTCVKWSIAVVTVHCVVGHPACL